MGIGTGGDTGIEGRYHGQVWGDFELGEELGRGPRGRVYRARQLSLSREVAVKVLDLTLSDDSAFRRRFLREAVAVAQIASPQVVHIHFAGVRDGHPWLAMELVEGPDLRARLRDGLKLSHAAAFDLVLQAARGVAAASRIGIVHRDLKPSNLLIDREGTLKIADFGLVGLAGESGVAPADLPYASPERIAGRPCDERSDLWSLGAIAYELLTRRAPVPLSDGSFEPLRAHDRALHADLEALVLRCLRTDPEERWPSAQALVGALEELLLAGKVLHRRRRSWAIATGVAAAAIIVGSLWSWRGMPSMPSAPSLPRSTSAPRPVPTSGSNAGAVVAPAVADRIEPAPPEPPPVPEPPAPAPTVEAKVAAPAPQPKLDEAPAAPSALAEPAKVEQTPTAAPVAAIEKEKAKEPAPEPAPAVPASAQAAVPAPGEEPAASATTIALASGSDATGRWADLRVLGVVQRFRWCPPGVFLMGSPDAEHRRGRDEDIHQVSLTRGFWIADTECSQALWITVMGDSPSAVQELSHPVERVSWDAVHVFMARLNRLCPGIDARLPTESEWEYACRAGGADASAIESTGWFERTSGGATHPIAQLQPNAWALFDMRGNVSEWCEDGYGAYPKPVVIDPPPPPGAAHVVRGGGCRDSAGDCRPAHRSHLRQNAASEWVGFRLALGCGEKPPVSVAAP